MIRQTAQLAAILLLSLVPCTLPVYADTRVSETESSHDGEPDDRIIELQQGVRQLEQRVKQLEAEKAAQEEAVRAITRDALSTVGSNINASVALGGQLEVIGGRFEDLTGNSAGLLQLNTLELEVEVQPNDWTLASLVIEYDEGTGAVFRTNEGFDASVDRINMDTAYITIGDLHRFPLLLTLGRIILPFGVSTGNPIADVPTIENPLTIDVFEMRNTAIGLNLGFPTPAPKPPTPPVTPPPVRPRVIKPLIGWLMKGLGYDPPLRPPPSLTPVIPETAPPPFHVGVYTYDGRTFEGMDSGGYNPGDHFSVTLGYRTKGTCGRPYGQRMGTLFCPWSFAINVDYISSVFDSRFLEVEYRDFLDRIGFVPGMAASVRTALGPVSLIGEWNGATDAVGISDDLGTPVNITPSAWQITLGYQFDWNPWVERIGDQGNYLAISYSESRDLAGVTRVFNGEPSRVGFAPQKRFVVSGGEWVMPGVKFSIEYSRNEDYPLNGGGTGNLTHDVFSALTIVW
ncbi:MAG: hypothetical protein HKP58_13940 [Desulfatitalea sp.]|nr:hypothetical protein [Desulfatitalea sp.]NNK01504.1 hypothetical protein [Desulfatitalea sp.]